MTKQTTQPTTTDFSTETETDTQPTERALKIRQSKAVAAYLARLDEEGKLTLSNGTTPTKTRARNSNPETLQKQITKLKAQIQQTPDLLKRLTLEQTKLEKEQKLAQITTEKSAASSVDASGLTQIELDFIEHAQQYSERKGISYKAWRTMKVPRGVLAKAGITY